MLTKRVILVFLTLLLLTAIIFSFACNGGQTSPLSSSLTTSTGTSATSTSAVLNLVRINEYRVDDQGANSLSIGATGEIGGKKYLFVEVQTQSDEKSPPPGILILNIDDPAKPVKLSYLQSAENTVWLDSSFLAGTTLFVCANNHLWVIDVSDPANPREITSLSGMKPSVLTVSGNYAYVYNNYQNITVLDISNISSPQVVGSLPLPSKMGMILDIYSNSLLIWTADTLYSIDISSPTSLKIVNTYKFTMPNDTSPSKDTSPAYVGIDYIIGNYAYVSLGYNGASAISVLDITDPGRPEQISLFTLKDAIIMGFYYSDQRI